MISTARTVDEYLAELPADRRAALAALRKLILRRLPPGYEESMQFGMIGYGVPLSRYPDTYNEKPLGLVALASQKQYMALYLMAVYADPAKERRLAQAFRDEGKKLDKGKACIRFQSLDALPLEALGELIGSTSVEEFIALYEANRGVTAQSGAARKKRKTTARKATRPLAVVAPSRSAKSRPAKKKKRPAG